MKAHTLRVYFFTVLFFSVFAVPGMNEDVGNYLNPDVYAADSWANNDTVTTKLGDVKGDEGNNTTWVWKAIPYARPPVGELRWQAPQDPDAWQEIRQSNEFCSWCPQTANDNGTSVLKGSEDCLYLNVWRPRSSESDLPVYFWIHGGSNKVGSADPYVGAPMAGKHDMVVVTINYRLGPLGWFTHPALRDGQASLNSSGNYALLDIIKALSWVRDNIGAFGGDPNNVTVAGQSAGGVNNLALMISPHAKDLFHRVISQSGEVDPQSHAEGDTYANSVIEALLVQDGTPADRAEDEREVMSTTEISAYLRSKTAADFFTVTAGLKGNPDVFNDGAVIPVEGAEAFDDPATYHQVPIIIGTTAEEGKLFMYLFGMYEFFPNMLYQWMGKELTRLTRITGIDSLAYKMSAHDTQPGVYSYIFEYGRYRRSGYNAWPTDTGPSDTMSWAMAVGASHGLDVPFNFGSFDSFSFFGSLGERIFREDNRLGWEALSETMMACNARFALTGDPNALGLPEWTQWPRRQLASGPRFMIFDADDNGEIAHMARDVR
ncbi:MAG: carboxylesterase family protein [Deltaproteobacteria bacterium]|nr:carboxylesterase family protein [Deltaproteobacteria bacterium]